MDRRIDIAAVIGSTFGTILGALLFVGIRGELRALRERLDESFAAGYAAGLDRQAPGQVRRLPVKQVGRFSEPSC